MGIHCTKHTFSDFFNADGPPPKETNPDPGTEPDSETEPEPKSELTILIQPPDADISTDDSPEGAAQPVGALMPGASADVNFTVTLPPMTDPYYYGACITLAGSNQSCSSGALIMESEPTQMVELGSMTNANLTAGESGYFRLTLESTSFLAIYTGGTTDTVVVRPKLTRVVCSKIT